MEQYHHSSISHGGVIRNRTYVGQLIPRPKFVRYNLKKNWHRRRRVCNCWLINSIRDRMWLVTCLTYHRAEFQVCSAGGLSVVIKPIGKCGHCDAVMLCCLKSGFKIILHFCKLLYSHQDPTLSVSSFLPPLLFASCY